MSKPIRVDEGLWASVMAPEGTVEWWFHQDGAQVQTGDKLAEVRIEGACHELVAPASGKLQIMAMAGSLIDPGAVIGQVVVP